MRADAPSLEVSDIDAQNYAAGRLSTLASPSLFGEPRFIRVSAVEKCNDQFLSEAIAYLESPADDTCVVLRHGGGVRGKRLLDAIRRGEGAGIEVVCAELTRESDRASFVSAEFVAGAKRVTPGAIRALVSAFGANLAELAAACRQLVADGPREIGEEIVDQYYGGHVEMRSFAVADAAIAGRYRDSLVSLRHAIASGADPVPIVAAFALKMRTMAKVLGVGGSSVQTASKLGLAPWQVDRARRDLRGWTDAGIGRCIELLAETDANVKGASRDPVFALEQMVRTISSRGAVSEGGYQATPR